MRLDPDADRLDPDVDRLDDNRAELIALRVSALTRHVTQQTQS